MPLFLIGEKGFFQVKVDDSRGDWPSTVFRSFVDASAAGQSIPQAGLEVGDGHPGRRIPKMLADGAGQRSEKDEMQGVIEGMTEKT